MDHKKDDTAIDIANGTVTIGKWKCETKNYYTGMAVARVMEG